MRSRRRGFRAYRQTCVVVAMTICALAGTFAGAQGETPSLIEAARRGDLLTVKALLKAGADVNAGRATGYTPLFMAAQSGHLDIVRALLAAKADPDTATAVGNRTPLTRALASGYVDIALELLNGGADPHARSMGGVTPLMLAAAASGSLPVVKSLIAAGVDVDAGTPPRFALSNCYPPPQPGAPPEVPAIEPAYWSGTCYYSAVGTALGRASASGNAEIVQALLDAHASVDARQVNENTPLTIASARGHVDVVRILLAAKADVGAVDENGYSSLMLASANGHGEVARVLLAAKADVNARARDGSTALMLAMYRGRAETAQRQQRAVVALLAAPGDSPQRTISTRRIDVVRTLLSAGADAGARDSTGRTALMLAEQNGHAEVADLVRSATAAVPARKTVPPRK